MVMLINHNAKNNGQAPEISGVPQSVWIAPAAKEFRNDSLDVTVRFTGEEFVIIGDAKRVPNRMMLRLYAIANGGLNEMPRGWRSL